MDEKVMLDFDDLLRLLVPRKISKNEPLSIFHYTPFESAVSITQEFTKLNGGAEFYHKRCDCFEDTAEGTEIDEIYAEVLCRIKNERVISEQTFQFLSKIKSDNEFYVYVNSVDSNGTIITHAVKEKLTPYICCFSKDPDNIKMWKKYLKGYPDGFSLGFFMFDIKEERNNLYGKGYQHFFLDVIYERDEKIKFIQNTLIKRIIPFIDKMSNDTIVYFVKKFLNTNKFRFKSESFDYEKEVRSVIYIADNDSNFHFDKTGTNIIFPFKNTKIFQLNYYGEPTSLSSQINGFNYSKYCKGE